MARHILQHTIRRPETLSTLNSFRYGFGLSLALCGISLAMLLNYLLPNIPWTPITMGLSIVCLVSSERLSLKGKMDSMTKMVFWFQILMLLYWCFSKDFDKRYNYLYFHLYVLAFIFVLKNNKDIVRVHFIGVLWGFTAILTLIFGYLHFTGLYSAHRAEYLDRQVLEVFTMDRAAFANLLVGYILLGRNKKVLLKIVFLMLIAIDIYVIIQSGKRSFFVNVFVALFYVVLRSRQKVSYTVYILLGTVISVLLIPNLQNIIVQFVDYTTSGFMDVYGGVQIAYDETSSSSIRAYAMSHALRDLQQFSLFEVLAGKGYYSYYIDSPILEAYLDMGIIGFWAYAMIIFIRPIQLFWKIPNEHKEAIVVYCMALMNIVISLTNNNPYQYFAYTPLCVLAIYLKTSKYETISFPRSRVVK